MELSDELVEKFGSFYTHPLFRELHPELNGMTFEQFLTREMRRLQAECKIAPPGHFYVRLFKKQGR